MGSVLGSGQLKQNKPLPNQENMRADLMADLRRLIEEKKLIQDHAVQMLGVSQSRVSDLVRGKREKFSLEMLITLATRAGRHISLNRAA
jgi:predicted XRE-type DNA-binding protein